MPSRFTVLDNWIQRLPTFSIKLFQRIPSDEQRGHKQSALYVFCRGRLHAGVRFRRTHRPAMTIFSMPMSFLIIGANMAVNHPVLFQMIRKRRALDPSVRIIAVDPRRTKTADFSDIHVPLAPGSDVAFLQLIAKTPPCRRTD